MLRDIALAHHEGFSGFMFTRSDGPRASPVRTVEAMRETPVVCNALPTSLHAFEAPHDPLRQLKTRQAPVLEIEDHR